MKSHEFCQASSLPDYECNECGLPPEHWIHSMKAECHHCGFVFTCEHANEHKGLCCDCYDLSWGMPLKRINAERKSKGLPPITKEWPKL